MSIRKCTFTTDTRLNSTNSMNTRHMFVYLFKRKTIALWSIEMEIAPCYFLLPTPFGIQPMQYFTKQSAFPSTSQRKSPICVVFHISSGGNIRRITPFPLFLCSMAMYNPFHYLPVEDTATLCIHSVPQERKQNYENHAPLVSPPLFALHGIYN